MLHENTLLVDTGAGNRPHVLILDTFTLGRLYAELNKVEAVYGEAAVTAPILARYLGEEAKRFWWLSSIEAAAEVATDESLPIEIRLAAAALGTNQPLPGSHGEEKGDGGIKARLIPPQPVKPSGGAQVLPEMLAAFGVN